MPDVTLTANIAKVNDEERMVYGFASVAKDGDKTLVDRQGDMISEVELVKMAHRFIKGARHGKVMHAGKPMAEIVESVVLRPEVAKALGLENFTKTAWVIGMKVHDDATWERVKKGELKAFSIGGKGKRVEVNKDGRRGRDGDGDGRLNEDEDQNGVGSSYGMGSESSRGFSGSGLGSALLTGGMGLGGALYGANRGARSANSYYRGRGALKGALIGGGLGLLTRGGLAAGNSAFSDLKTGAMTGAALGGLGGVGLSLTAMANNPRFMSRGIFTPGAGSAIGRAGLRGAGLGLLGGAILGGLNPFHSGR